MKTEKRIRLALVGTDSLRGKEIKNVLSKKTFPLKNIDFYVSNNPLRIVFFTMPR